MDQVDVPYYLDFLPPAMLERLSQESEPIGAIDGLRVANGLRSEFPNLETDAAMAFVCELYVEVKALLAEVLAQRLTDRAFLDRETEDCVKRNENVDYLSPDYETVVGKRDSEGRTVIGPRQGSEAIRHYRVHVPERLRGFQVTLFGPPDSAKMSINAMNAFNRRPTDEHVIVTELVESAAEVPRWGADNEDSKTPIMTSLLRASENLIGCFDRTIRYEDPRNGKTYRLDDERLSIPIKRIPGLALPDGNHLLHGNPLPLHLFDFAMHLFHNWQRAEALMFYVPKLENEFEAAYLKFLVQAAEHKIKMLHPEYEPGTVRLFVVFENPRAIFRISEIADTLAPYFLGGSLGWHDFLASTARLFKNDPNYRIPVKADPNIVINHVRESHHLLVDALKPLGALTIGGMYGTLFEDDDPESYQVSMVGFIKDVIAQLKRGLDGFWVAHPAFVRPGLALVEAFRQSSQTLQPSQWDDPHPNESVLSELIEALVPNESESKPLLAFVFSPDVPGLDKNNSLYLRSVLAASIATSDVIANDDPEEVRYNVFQAVQYLTDWLGGNGCVALPASMNNASGQPVFVRVMDDLATTERSRWELWAEVNHGRVSVESFEQILEDELVFIQSGNQTETKRPQVRWEGAAVRWYPIAAKILRQLVLDEHPVEFVTELLMPFTFDVVRNSPDPWRTVNELCPGKYT